MKPSTNHYRTFRPWLSSLLLAPFMTASLLAGDKEPVAMAPAASQPDDSGWEFQIKPYGWMTGLSGTTGVGGFLTEVDVDSMEVIDHLNWAFFLQAEARKGPWGILFDGYYAELSGGGTPPNGLYSQSDFTLGQGMAEVALAYRVIDGDSGYVDVFGGVRYNSLEVDINAYPSQSGVRKAGEDASDRIIGNITERARDAVAGQRARIQAAAQSELAGIKQGLVDKITSRPDNGLPPVLRRKLVQPGHKDSHTLVLAKVQDERRDLIAAAVDARVAAIRSEVRSRVDARLTAAEKKLAKAIERELSDRLPRNVNERKEWVDPFVGTRARWNLNQDIFLAARADIGGFGVGSELTWQAAASLGWQINEAWSAELGYRHLDADYEDGAFLYDMASSGVFVSCGFEF